MRKGLFTKKKFAKKGKRTNKEKILITLLISTIIILLLAFGYDVYCAYQTKEEIDFLNGAITQSGEEKSQLILEQEELNQTVNFLTEQKDQLNTEINALSLELDALQTDYDALQEDYDTCSTELQDVEDDLETCENP